MNSAFCSPLTDWCPAHPWACHRVTTLRQLPTVLLFNMTLYAMGYPWNIRWGSCVPSQLLVHPQTPCCGGGWGAEKSLALSKNCSVIIKHQCANIILTSNPKYGTVPVTRSRNNSIPAKIRAVVSLFLYPNKLLKASRSNYIATHHV